MITYPDVAHFQAGLKIQPGTPALIAKASQGTGFTDPSYPDFKSQAARVGAVFGAYHWLEHGNTAAQANHCFAVVGKTPLMIDAEEVNGAALTVADIVGFIDAFRARGGIVHLLYLPHWYWAQNMAAPNLTSVANRGMFLVSSNYSGYSDTGVGWAGYGGMSVKVWQYTSTQSYGGQNVDFNAFKGTPGEFAQLLGGDMASVDDVYNSLQGLRTWVNILVNDQDPGNPDGLSGFKLNKQIRQLLAGAPVTLTDAQISQLAAQVTANHPKLGVGDEPAIVDALKKFFTPAVSG